MNDTTRLTLGASPDGMLQGALLPDGTPALQWIEQPDAPWVPLGGSFASPPAVVTDRAGTLWAFARAADGSVHQNHRVPGSVWAGWSSLGGGVTDAPSACLDADGRVVVFGRGTDGALWHLWYEAGIWSAWTSLGGQILCSPAALLTAEGRLTAFAIGTDGALWHRFHAGGWSDWISLEGKATASPAAVVDAVGTLRVFVRGDDQALWTRAYDAGWTPWASLGGIATSAPVVAVDRDGRMHARVVSTDDLTVHESVGIVGWEDWAAVSELPQTAPDRTAEEEAFAVFRAELSAHPAVQALARRVADVLELSVLRAARIASDPTILPASEAEAAQAARFRRLPEERRARLFRGLHERLAGHAALRAERPELASGLELRFASSAVAHVLGESERARLERELDPAADDLRQAFRRLLRPGLRPQGGKAMQLQIHSLRCAEETDEVGDDSLVMEGFTLAPGGIPVKFGPHDLGDFAEGDVRSFDPATDDRMSFAWPGGPLGTLADPYLAQIILIERDGALDPKVIEHLDTAIGVVTPIVVAAIGGPAGAVVGVVIAVVWKIFSDFWNGWLEEEVAPPITLRGWFGMAGANAPQTTFMEWDGGRYELTYSWSPCDFPEFEFPPHVPGPLDLEFELLDPGPFTQIGADGDPTSGLWARRPSGRVVYRRTLGDPWIEVSGPNVQHLDDGWALLEGQTAGRFVAGEARYETHLSRADDTFLTLTAIAGSAGARAWGISGEKVWRMRPETARPRPGGPAFAPAMSGFWFWDEIPSPGAMSGVWATREHIWALDADKTPHEWVQDFQPRPVAGFKITNLAVGIEGDVWAVAPGGQVFGRDAGTWQPVRCYVVRQGQRIPLVARQARLVGRTSGYVSAFFLLTSEGKLYVRRGSTVPK